MRVLKTILTMLLWIICGVGLLLAGIVLGPIVLSLIFLGYVWDMASRQYETLEERERRETAEWKARL